MARARNIKPGFYKNEDLAECSVWARYIFPGLWMLADREGRLEDRPKRIKGELLPFDAQPIEPLLAELAARKDAQGVPFIVRYQNADGSFIQISKFSTHQTPHYSEKQSAIKAHEPREKRGNGAASIPENSEKPPPIKRGSQPPDSLNPDLLIPDSLNPESLATRSGVIPANVAPDGGPRCAALTAICDVSRVEPGARRQMHVRQWAAEGVTDPQLADAIAIARESKPHPAVIPAKYLATILPDVLNGTAKSPTLSQAEIIARTIATVNAQDAANAAH